MSEISVYSFEDAEGNEYGSYTTLNYQEAKKYAQESNLRLMENIYEWSERLPVEGDDYTGSGREPDDATADDEEEAAAEGQGEPYYRDAATATGMYDHDDDG